MAQALAAVPEQNARVSKLEQMMAHLAETQAALMHQLEELQKNLAKGLMTVREEVRNKEDKWKKTLSKNKKEAEEDDEEDEEEDE